MVVHVYQMPLILHLLTSFLLLSIINHAQFVKRDAILEIERAVQQRWERERVFEVDAPQVVL